MVLQYGHITPDDNRIKLTTKHLTGSSALTKLNRASLEVSSKTHHVCKQTGSSRNSMTHVPAQASSDNSAGIQTMTRKDVG